jgi:hypothetical protein
MRGNWARSLRLGYAAVVALTVVGLRAEPQSDDAPVQYSATAINMDAPAGFVATPVDILIQRWSTDAERDTVMNAILEGSQAQTLEALQSLPRIGTLRSPGSIGWDLRYARHSVGTDGRERVMVITDRPISFWEIRNMTRSTEYPFTFIELRIGSDGRGEGTITVGTKVIGDPATDTIILENYAFQPIQLNAVRREK